MSLLRITDTQHRSSIFAGLLLGVALAGCSSKKGTPVRKDAGAPPPRDPQAECGQLFDRFHAGLAPHVAQIGLHEKLDGARKRDQAGLTTCTKLDEAKRKCLLGAPAEMSAWSTCEVEPPFTLFDSGPVYDALLGPGVLPADSVARVAELAGTWLLPGVGLDDTITWKISRDGTLAAKRTSKKQGSHDDPVRQLAFTRDRQLALKSGTSSQFVPFFADSDHLYLSWTSGALPIRIANEQQFALELADGGRWIVWTAPACTLIDPRAGDAKASCGWEEQDHQRAFVVHGTTEQRWGLHGGVLVHPKMEVFTKQR